METHTVENSPQRYARIGGALYLAIIVLGGFAEGFVASKITTFWRQRNCGASASPVT
jgi:hypothetical protein